MDKRAIIISIIGAGGLGLAVLVCFTRMLEGKPSPYAVRSLPHTFPKVGLDSGMDAIQLVRVGPPVVARGNWMRLPVAQLEKAQDTRESLRRLRAAGVRICVLLRWPDAKDWKKAYLPVDMRAAYEYGHKHGAAFGDLVDAWEVDNEPDLGFVPESAERYAAFLKATWLGLKQGIAENKANQLRVKSYKSGGPNIPSNEHLPPNTKEPLVIMGSMGLPPGPWLERFAANDGFAYTDGFNYHYYGYAEDFTSIYRQHERAVAELATGYTESSHSADSASSVLKKDWPVFLTEIGYGMLSKQARDTKEGRLRQWQWFKAVGGQVAQLRIEAPMAFYLLPFLDRPSDSEFGLTVPAVQVTNGRGQRTDGAPIWWQAGEIKYTAGDFGARKPEPWMDLIGREIGENETTPALAWWLAAPRGGAELEVKGSGLFGPSPKNKERLTNNDDKGRSWNVSVTRPSPVVLDFLPGDGLSPIKRYNGSFVVAKSLVPEVIKPPAGVRPPATAPSRTEEFIIQVRTKNGNLYEVYPTRLAMPEWQHFMEPHDNFTMSFYGRAELPWRFKDNRPASLVVVAYPKQLPVVFEFRHPMLTRLANTPDTEIAEGTEKAKRYGRGKVVLYNFSNKPVTGRLYLPDGVTTAPPENTKSTNFANSASSVLNLTPGERREVQVNIQVDAKSFIRMDAPISFVPEDTAIPPARFLTTFIPDIGGMKATVVGKLLNRLTVDYTKNADLVRNRPRASEEAPMIEQFVGTNNQEPINNNPAFAQPGAKVERTPTGFTVTITSIPPGKPQRIEVEIPWPDDLDFSADAFLSMEFRLR